MKWMLLAGTATVVSLSLGSVVNILRTRHGHYVSGRITYLEHSAKAAGCSLLTFSYTAGGERFHKNFSDTLHGHCAQQLQALGQAHAVGDTVQVWVAHADSQVCCIGPPPTTGTRILTEIKRLIGGAVDLAAAIG
ncbi:DUF3592 domain-containing protein [Pseudomonas sp. RIT-PI-S]|uniref:DUF3592 domain-containing protein n=1 Tax=Pseudomonas sp. RIT-PI-S TaxID=3035295 RepID=UPI0021D9CEE3|nr:DUF3592 domain-containing protein [Pseudomonas sp. RIT-PI-S]